MYIPGITYQIVTILSRHLLQMLHKTLNYLLNAMQYLECIPQNIQI